MHHIRTPWIVDKMAETALLEELSLADKENKPESNEESAPATGSNKIDILLKATGDAPIMKRKKWAVDQEKKIGWVIEFIKKYLKLDASDSLFLYVNQCFAPSPDQIVRNLYQCFGTDGKLTLYYCKTQAWG